MPKFDESVKSRLDELVSRYPHKRAALLPSLWVAQEVYGGWLPEEAMQEVADHLGLPRAEVEGVATFYTMYNKAPVGAHHIEICHNISCLLYGADKLIDHCAHRLGIAKGETTPDGAFTLNGSECLGACCNAPAVMVGGVYFEDVTPEKMDSILETLRTTPSEVASPPQAQISEQTKF